jgi:hypothetical protein
MLVWRVGGPQPYILLPKTAALIKSMQCSVLWNDQPGPATILDVLIVLAPLDAAEPLDYKTG